MLDPKINRHMEHEKSADRQRERDDMKRLMDQGEKPWQRGPGVMSVVDAVRDVEFPKTVDDLKGEVGDREVLTSGDKKFALTEVLDRLGRKLDPRKDPLLEDKAFPSLKDFQSTVQRHWEGIQRMEVPEDQRPEGGGFQPQERESGTSGKP